MIIYAHLVVTVKEVVCVSQRGLLADITPVDGNGERIEGGEGGE